MSQINNLTGIGKLRPSHWGQGAIFSYLSQIELWIKQVTDKLRGVSDTAVFNVAELPPAADYDPTITGRASIVYVLDESGGAQLAFSDGTNWRRVSDRAIVS